MFRSALMTGVMAIALAACAIPETASREETVELTGVVRGIDVEARRLVIEGEDRTVVYRVSDEVRNLAEVQVGDEVALEYYEGVALAMADPADSGEAITDTFAGRAPEGARPAAGVASVTSFVVELISYDGGTGIATIRTPEGAVTSVRVAEEFRRFASTREPGDRILVLVEEAVAVGVSPA